MKITAVSPFLALALVGLLAPVVHGDGSATCTTYLYDFYGNKLLSTCPYARACVGSNDKAWKCQDVFHCNSIGANYGNVKLLFHKACRSLGGKPDAP